MAKRILVIEDQTKVSAVVQRRLESAGYEVITALDGPEGLGKARSGKPDLIVLDLILPGISGYQVCTLLKKDDACKQIPVLILTARAQEQDIKEGMRVGAEAYMTKPYKSGALLAKVAELLAKPRT